MQETIFTVTLLACSFYFAANEVYRVPLSGDSGTYFIISSEKGNDGILTVLSSRIGKDNAYTDFTKLNVNFQTKQYF
ncbi:hypothetical protein [Aeromonas bivalvium]|uniref:hypothetical protein n=1 Tax=Aeromonas bivalvium TaxID=440079 RepID=UPI0005AAE52E|nr:hypothetical protein [Aeromonas bivalvium]